MHKLILSLWMLFLGVLTEAKTKMITFYTPSHKSLYTDYFMPSYLKSGLDKHFVLDARRFLDQDSKDASYMSAGWNSTMMRKVDLILETIDSLSEKDVFVYSDIDIQFFKTFDPKKFLGDRDIVIQANSKGSDYACAGFLIAKANNAVKNLFLNVKEKMENNPSLDDQTPLNGSIRDAKLSVNWSVLPDIFFNPALFKGPVRWNPGDKIILPEGIILHHANWTVGIENKLNQLDYVKDLIVS